MGLDQYGPRPFPVKRIGGVEEGGLMIPRGMGGGH